MAKEGLDRCVVILGGSLAGLLAAAAWAPFVARVIVLERDRALPAHEPRHGVPHAVHVHGVLSSGLRAIEQLLPGIGAELEAQGAQRIRPLRDVIYCDGLGIWPRHDSGPEVLALSRLQLEAQVRARVCMLANVEIWLGCSAESIACASSGFVCAVHLLRDGSFATKVPCDVAIDASGTGRFFLETCQTWAGIAVRETRYRVDVGYASARFEGLDLPDNALGVFVSGQPPGQTTGGVVLAQGQGTFVVSLVGRGASWPPGDLAGFRAFAHALPYPTLGKICGLSRPVSPIKRFAVRESVRRHVSGLPVLVQGLYALGDAVCRFNPVHGQGLSATALQAVLMQELAKRSEPGLEREYWWRLDRILDVPWRFSTSPDLSFSTTIGKRPWWLPFGRHAAEVVAKAAFVDPELRAVVAEVYNLNRSPTELMTLRRISRLLRGWRIYEQAAGRARVAGPNRPVAVASEPPKQTAEA